MTAASVLYHPIVVFAISLLCGCGIYAFGKAVAPVTENVGGKLKAYACGEDVDGKRFPTAYHLFHAAFIFTLLDVVALVIGTVSVGAAIWLTVSYIAVGLLAIIILFRD